MDLGAVVDNLVSPAVCFFVVGAVAVWVRSDLALPDQVARWRST